jgi:hypothetical protein
MPGNFYVYPVYQLLLLLVVVELLYPKNIKWLLIR